VMTEDELTGKLVAFIESILPEDQHVEIDERTPLLESGILDSLKTAILLNYINNELKLSVPTAKLSAKYFKDARTIAETIGESMTSNLGAASS
jgi:acyl carrier protein